MNQCRSCDSYNDEAAVFCSQCGAPLGGAKRRLRAAKVRSAVRILLLSASAGALLFVLRVLFSPEAPPVAAPVGTPVDENVSELASEAAVSSSAPEELQPSSSASPEEPSALDAKAATAFVRKALVTIELKNDSGRLLRAEPGLLVAPDGVVLARYRSLLGAYEGTCLLPGPSGQRVEIVGISYRDELLDLALLRIGASPRGYEAVPILPADPDGELGAGDPIFVFVWDQVIETAIADPHHLCPDGLVRAVLSDSPRVPQNAFLALASSGFAIGLCRLEGSGRLYPPSRLQPPSEYRVVVDPASRLLEALDLPAAVTLSTLTRAYYEGTFGDYLDRGLLAARRSAWKESIDALRKALERVGQDRPPDEEVELATTTLKTALYEEINRLGSEERDAEAVLLAEEAANLFPEEVVFLLRLGELRFARKEWLAGTEAFVRARELWSSTDLDALLEEGYLQLAAQADLRGDRRSREATLLDGLRQLPTSAKLHLELARLYFETGAYREASTLLVRSKELSSSVAPEADALLARIDDILKRREAVIIPFDPDGRSIRVQGRIDGVRPLNLIIDTGATYTAIPLHVAEELGYRDAILRAPIIQVNTAGGTFVTRKIPVRSLSIGGFSVSNLEVLVIPQTSGEEFGLLGLNFLKEFRYTVDASRKEFRIERP